MTLSFTLPQINDNEDGSWGPSTSTLPPQFKDIPYAPFSKSDKIARIADWHDPVTDTGRSGRQGYTRRPGREAYGASESNAFGYVHEEDERSFSLVDSGARTNVRSKIPMRGRGRGGFVQRGGQYGSRGGRGWFGGRGGRSGGRGGYNDWNKPQRTRDSSITISPSWTLLEEIDFTRLLKLSLGVEAPEDLESHGMIQSYDKAFDRVNTKNEKPLEILERVRYNASTSEDPVIAQLASRNAAHIFATDSILSVLMCAPRSVNSWDLILDRRGDQLFMDKREGGAYDYLSVNENASDPPADSDDPTNINSPASLSLEATYINHNFACQVIAPSSKPYEPAPNPFYSPEQESEPPASCLYRYRKFDLSVEDGEEMDLVVRTEVDAYLGKRDTLITVNALNEFDPRVQGGQGKALDWRKNLDQQKGAIVAGEMKNNSAKLARWAVQSVLAGAEVMKMGYISRANPRDAQRHVIVGLQSYRPTDFARQMNVSLNNGWGIVRTIADLALKQPEGKYILVKDPNNPIIRMYKVPDDAFDAGEIDEDQMEDEPGPP